MKKTRTFKNIFAFLSTTTLVTHGCYTIHDLGKPWDYHLRLRLHFRLHLIFIMPQNG